MNEEERAWHYALRLLAIRPRACGELRQRLLGKGFSPELVSQILKRAEEEGLVDDRAFARLYAEERFSTRPRPRRLVAAELRAKGIEPRLAAEAAYSALPDLTEEELARLALAEKKHRWESLPKEKVLKRAYSFLLRRGFSPDLARKVVEEAFGPWNSASE
ncbi:MAG: recombination regulator RecX [Candidatus Bipolaricaulota bacterium]|nr:recombination regulator RecX [Candidatus Bipolaricaulota bacterium]MDW8126444.1 regulatory protein RecX [Candidatus Bipolaricaulota bacterium]